MRWLSIDRIPLLVMCLVMLASWWGADYFGSHAVMAELSPFTPVYVAYDANSARGWMIWIFTALAIGWVVPVGRSASIEEVLLQSSRLTRLFGAVWWAAALGSLGVLLFAKGPYLLYASQYLMYAQSDSVSSLATLASPMGVVAAGAVSARRPRWGAALCFVLTLAIFATASRILCLIPVMYLLGRVLGGVRVRTIFWLLAVIAALISLPIPLINRGLPEHGLIPYAASLPDVVGRPDYLDSIFLTFGENIGLTVPLVILVSRVEGITVSDMLISVNPLPGGFAGWPRIMPSLRVHDFVPYSALGEWASFGPEWLMVGVVAWAVAVRASLASVARGRTPIALVVLAAQLAMSFLTVFQLTQYNTRSTARIISLMIVLAVFERLTRTWFDQLTPRYSLGVVGARRSIRSASLKEGRKI